MSLEQLMKSAREEMRGRFMSEETQLAIEDLIPSLARKAYLQGIRDAKGAVPEEERKEDHETHSLDCDMDASHGYVLTHKGCSAGLDNEAVGWNLARKETLEAITRLEEGTDV